MLFCGAEQLLRRYFKMLLLPKQLPKTFLLDLISCENCLTTFHVVFILPKKYLTTFSD